jgi:predicted HD superfamily hydrolase involved in NAD metabolism
MDCMGSDEAEVLLLSLLESNCKATRMLHSLSVADTAEALCRRFGIAAFKGRIAGLGHDIVKDRPIGEQWSLASRAADHPETAPLVDLVESLRGAEFADKVVHGPAGAVFLLEAGLVRSEEVLRSVAYHSTARMGMGSLEKLLFAADKLEPGRSSSGPGERRALQDLGLDDLFLYSLGRSISYLGSKGGAIAQSTIDLYNALESAGRGTCGSSL